MVAGVDRSRCSGTVICLRAGSAPERVPFGEKKEKSAEDSYSLPKLATVVLLGRDRYLANLSERKFGVFLS